MDGSSTRPCSSGRHSATPLRTAATSECVVPRSMPTAIRRWCGSGDCPGSEICRSAIALLSQLLRSRIDVVAETLDEHEGSPLLGRGFRVALSIKEFLDLAQLFAARVNEAL